MRPRRIIVPAVLAAVALGPSAFAASTQTAKDLQPKASSFKGFSAVTKPAVVKGPISQRDSCGRTVTFAPKGATYSAQSLERGIAQSADGSAAIVDQLQVVTILTKSTAAAASVWSGLQLADEKCRTQTTQTQVGDVPVTAQATVATTRGGGIKGAQWGFLETVTLSGTATVQGSTAPISGAVQSLIYQRGRAITIVSVDRLSIVTSNGGQKLVSLGHLVNGQTQSALKTATKLAVAALGKQKP